MWPRTAFDSLSLQENLQQTNYACLLRSAALTLLVVRPQLTHLVEVSLAQMCRRCLSKLLIPDVHQNFRWFRLKQEKGRPAVKGRSYLTNAKNICIKGVDEAQLWVATTLKWLGCRLPLRGGAPRPQRGLTFTDRRRVVKGSSPTRPTQRSDECTEKHWIKPQYACSGRNNLSKMRTIQIIQHGPCIRVTCQTSSIFILARLRIVRSKPLQSKFRKEISVQMRMLNTEARHQLPRF